LSEGVENFNQEAQNEEVVHFINNIGNGDWLQRGHDHC